jgi:chemotaxis methyl-accepting protein methylase
LCHREEAFSIAITLSEYLKETGVSFPVQIFASDIATGHRAGKSRQIS